MGKRGLHEMTDSVTIGPENKGFAVRFLPLTIICLMTTALAGCETHQAVDQQQTMLQRQPLTAPAQQDILSLGREMSNGSVDIYEPGTNSVDIPTQATFSPRPSPVAENPNIIVRDQDVTVYSLDADASAAQLTPLDREPQAPAAPARQYAPELTPTPDPQGALPNLQPPIAARGQYASPFTSGPGSSYQ